MNNEFNHVFAVTLRQELPRHAYRLQAEEVDDVKHIALSELGALLREGDEKHVTYLAGLGRQGGALENAKVSLGKGGGEGHYKSAPRGREGMTQRQILPTPGGRGGGPGLGRAAFGGVRAQPLGARSPGRTAPDPPPAARGPGPACVPTPSRHGEPTLVFKLIPPTRACHEAAHLPARHELETRSCD